MSGSRSNTIYCVWLQYITTRTGNRYTPYGDQRSATKDCRPYWYDFTYFRHKYWIYGVDARSGERMTFQNHAPLHPLFAPAMYWTPYGMRCVRSGGSMDGDDMRHSLLSRESHNSASYILRTYMYCTPYSVYAIRSTEYTICQSTISSPYYTVCTYIHDRLLQ